MLQTESLIIMWTLNKYKYSMYLRVARKVIGLFVLSISRKYPYNTSSAVQKYFELTGCERHASELIVVAGVVPYMYMYVIVTANCNKLVSF